MFNLMKKMLGVFVFLDLVFSTAVASERISLGIDLDSKWVTDALGDGWENCPIIPDDTPFNEVFPYNDISDPSDTEHEYKWFTYFEDPYFFGGFVRGPGKTSFSAYKTYVTALSFDEVRRIVKDVFWYRGQLFIYCREYDFPGLIRGDINRWYSKGSIPYYSCGIGLKSSYHSVTLIDLEGNIIDEFTVDMTEWNKHNNPRVVRVSNISGVSVFHFKLRVNGPIIDNIDTTKYFVFGLGPYRTKDLEQRLWEFLNGIGNGFNGEPIPDFENPVTEPDITVLFPDFQPEQTVMLGVNTTEARGGETLEVQVKVNDTESNPVLEAFGMRTKKIPERSKVYVLVVIGGEVLFAPGFTREMQGIDIVPGKGLYKVLTLPVPKGFGKTKAQWIAGVLDEDFNIIGDIHEVDTDIGD